jgi:hypothetical protein
LPQLAFSQHANAKELPMKQVTIVVSVALLLAAPTLGMAQEKKKGGTPGTGQSQFAPGQKQTTPGTAKDFAPGQRQTDPGTAKKFAPGQQKKTP